MKADTFKGKVCIVTGAASGIGRALSLELAQMGAHLAISDVNMDGLSETQGLLSDKVGTVLADKLNVADAKMITAYAGHVEKALGPADFLFNVAGLSRVGEFRHTPMESIEKVMDVNLYGVVRMTKAFIDQLILTKGVVVNISSIFGIIGYKGQTHYCASKFAVRGFSETLKLEMDDYGVGVCSVHPGGVATNVARNAEVDHLPNDGRTREEMTAEFDKMAITSPQKAAQIILNGAEKRQLRIIVGSDAKFVSLVQRVFPQSYSKVLNIFIKDKALS